MVFQILAIYNFEKLSYSIKIMSKWVQHVTEYEIKLNNIAKAL